MNSGQNARSRDQSGDAFARTGILIVAPGRKQGLKSSPDYE